MKADRSFSFEGDTIDGRASMIQVITSCRKQGAGDAGTLEIQANDISFTGPLQINSTTLGRGKGGTVTMDAAGSVTFAGEVPGGQAAKIRVATAFKGEGAGDAGKLEIKAGNILFKDGASVNSTTYGMGKGGEVILKAADSVTFTGEGHDGEYSGVKVASDYKGEDAGDAGNLLIRAKDISFISGASVNSTTYGKGRGGEVVLRADGTVSFSGEGSAREGSNIQVASEYREQGAGDAGTLIIQAENISLANGAFIDSGTRGKGMGGSVTLEADGMISLSGADTRGKVSRIYAGSESRAGNAGTGGKISVSARILSLSDGTAISTSGMGGGKAGDIEIVADRVFLDTGAMIASGMRLSMLTLLLIYQKGTAVSWYPGMWWKSQIPVTADLKAMFTPVTWQGSPGFTRLKI
ncbi:MAG: hypothetical protein GY749_28120 [Desulfobacteraceae bacterium]|nr:hypothetical protein [Desulfobacteraceae bacterium]